MRRIHCLASALVCPNPSPRCVGGSVCLWLLHPECCCEMLSDRFPLISEIKGEKSLNVPVLLPLPPQRTLFCTHSSVPVPQEGVPPSAPSRFISRSEPVPRLPHKATQEASQTGHGEPAPCPLQRSALVRVGHCRSSVLEVGRI